MMDKQQNSKIIDLIFDLSRLVKTGMYFERGNKHLTVHQLQTLLYISKQKEIRMADISKNFNITKPTATVLINSLVNNGYIKRNLGKIDKREVKISLAKKGQKLLDQATKARSKKIDRILSFVSSKEKKQLEQILQTIVDRLKKSNEN